ncbi:MAG: HesA/MoeB/ThiF family protein [Muribaculaceae bacterium]|nr:HesA/MoeB/ThiF family protein [Muribaculaceae bacterium]
MDTLGKEELIRYARTIAVEEIGREGQARLRQASVLVVGCGALGNIASAYLCGAGISRLAIADFDTIDISNLQRQIMYTTPEVGERKSAVLARRLRAMNPDVEVVEIDRMIRRDDAESLFRDYDFIIDGSDNPATKFMTSEVCCGLRKACCIGGVAGFKGQLVTWTPGHTAFHELFGPQKDATVLPCSMAGVIGPLPGIVGAMQAAEAIKHITGAGETLAGRLLRIDLLTMDFKVFSL